MKSSLISISDIIGVAIQLRNSVDTTEHIRAIPNETDLFGAHNSGSCRPQSSCCDRWSIGFHVARPSCTRDSSTSDAALDLRASSVRARSINRSQE